MKYTGNAICATTSLHLMICCLYAPNVAQATRKMILADGHQKNSLKPLLL